MRVFLMALVLLVIGGAAQAACNVPAPPAFSQKPRLDTMTSDNAKIEGGCIDNTPIGQNTPAKGNFTELTINGVPVNEAGTPQVLPTDCTGLPDGAAYNNNGVPAICGVVTSTNALLLNGGGCVALNGGGCVVLNP